MRRNPLPLFALSLVLALALAACGEPEDPVLEQPPIDDPIGEDEADDEPPADDDAADDDTAGGSDSREITIATADAADRAGVAADDVTVAGFELVTWPDGSLGCPEPDTMYTQALVEGYRIVLEAGGERYTYHGALGDDPFHCADPGEPVDAGA
ncbi:MAG: hypothetical protein ACNA8R_00585 [Nitriliruptoraceae bacterium]